MSALTITCIVLALATGLALVGRAVWAEEQRRRREWRPDGAGSWWHRPLPSVALAQSVRVIDARPPAELVTIADVRIVGDSAGARTDGVRSAPKRAQRVRRVNAKRKQARGAA